MSELLQDKETHLDGAKSGQSVETSPHLALLGAEDQAVLRTAASKTAEQNSAAGSLPGLAIDSNKPLPTIEVPPSKELDSPSWQRPLEYKKNVPGEYLQEVTQHSTADDRVTAALGTIKAEDIKESLDELSGNKPMIIDGKPVTIESRSSFGDGYEKALQLFKQNFEKDGFTVVEDSYTRQGQTFHNLRAIKEGKTKPDEVVMFGAHIDSTAGAQDTNEKKAPGADDDGTGAVALAEIGHAIKDLPLDRTVVLSLFSGEEQGLWGSRAMAELYKQSQDNVTHDLNKTGAQDATNPKIVAMYQMDMIGYAPDSKTVEVHDTSDNAEMHALTDVLNQQAQQNRLDLKVYGAHNDTLNDRSDHYNFQNIGVPAVVISEPYDTAAHENPNYHSTHDTVDQLNIPFVVNVAKMATAAGITLAGLENK